MFSSINELTVEINRVIVENFSQLVSELLPIFHSRESPLNPSDPTTFNKKYNATLSKLQIICARHPQCQLLVAARKIPFSYVEEAHILLPLLIDRNKSHAIFNRSASMATNCILRYASKGAHRTAAYSEDLILDACRIIIICNIRVILQSVSAGIKLLKKTDEIDVPDLMNFFINRQDHLDKDNLCDGDETAAIVKLVSLNTLPFGKTISVHFVPENADAELELVNYFPFFSDAEMILKEYGWLAELGFQSQFALPLEKFWTCFVLINKHITDKLVGCELDQPFLIADESDEYRLKFLFGLTETGLIQISKDKLLSLYSQKSSIFPDITNKDFHEFLAQVTLDEKAAKTLNIDFPEDYYLFYPGDADGLLWDISRHTAMFRAISRKLVQGGDEAGNIKGKAYEDNVVRELESIEGIEDLKQVTIYSDDALKLMEIDIGFVFHDTLYLLEVKSWQRKIGEYLGSFDKSHRAIGYLKEYDELLKIHQERIFSQWLGCKIDKAIYVLVSLEAQYIPSYDPDLWLIPGIVPRICLLREFISYLRGLNS